MAVQSNLLDLLIELQALDRVPRLGYSLRGVPDPESVSEHLFHLVFLVWALAAREENLDRARAVELALIHDLAEVRFGDLPRPAAHYLPPGAKAAAEKAAMADLLAPLGDSAQGLFEDYQESTSREARFVSLCDKLQLLIKATVYQDWRAGNVDEFLDGIDAFDDGGFSSIKDLITELIRRRDPTGGVAETAVSD